jgi:hypothetical protein
MTPLTVGFYREAWLLLAQGGWWTLRQILEYLPSGCEVDDPYNRLWVMERRHGYVVSRGSGRDREFSLADDSVIPYGIPLSRLKAVLAGEEVA